MRMTIALNELGKRVGDSHPRAQLTDAEVEVIRKLHSHGLSYQDLSEKFEVSKRAVAAFCRYERRGQTAVKWKTIEVSA